MNFWDLCYKIYRERKDRKYAAAKNSPTLNIPNNTSGTVNDELDVSWDEVTERTLALVRDFPIFAGAISNMEAFLTADGIKPQVTIKNKSGKIDKKKSEELEAAFMSWANDPERCDSAGRMTLWEMQALADRMEGEFGEFLFVETTGNKGYSLTAVEPLTLSDGGFKYYKQTATGSVIWRGIEYNPNNHKVLAYHFEDPGDANSLWKIDTVRVPKNRVLHGFKMLRAGQMRGITPFAPAILSAYSLRDYMGSELAAQNMSAKWMAWVTAPMSGMHGDLTNRGNIDYDSSYEKYVKTLDYATIEYLKQGEQVTLNTQQRQANSFKNFNEIIIRYVAAAIGMPYELLSQDYSGLNFTTLRAVRNDFKQALRPRWERKISQFCQPVYEHWLRSAVLKGEINLPDYFTNKEKYHNVRWIKPTLEQIDPLKEFTAELMKVKAGAKSMQSVIKGLGEDPDKVLEEAALWKDQVDEKELVFPELTSQNPLISNFEIIEQEEPEPEPVQTEPEVQEDDQRQLGIDENGNKYEQVGGVWRPLE